MKKWLWPCIIMVLWSMLSAFSTEPVLQPDGRRWRVAYAESGYYDDYQAYFCEVVQDLMDMGWIDETEIPKPGEKTAPVSLWNWAVENLESDYLEFVSDAGWSYQFDNDTREDITEAVLRRLNRGDIDLLLIFGTMAGQELANDKHSVNCYVISTTDPIGAGIIESAEISGYPHVSAYVSPERYRIQLRMFYDIFHFKRLGVVYEDTPRGRSYAALEDVYAVADERGFEVVEVHCINEHPDIDFLYQELMLAYETLAPQVDAVYLTDNSAHAPEYLASLLQPFVERNIPTFNQSGEEMVQYGALLSLVVEEIPQVARFTAEKIARSLNGELPGDQPLGMTTTPRLAINLEMARRIGWNPPIDIINICNPVYTEIKDPPSP